MKFNFKFLAVPVLAASLAAMPLNEASARGGYWHHGGGVGIIAGATVGIIGAAALLVTAPFRLAADVVAPGPAPVAYAPPPQQAYYAPAPVYAAPPQAYYAPPVAYYQPRYYRPYYGY